MPRNISGGIMPCENIRAPRCVYCSGFSYFVSISISPISAAVNFSQRDIAAPLLVANRRNHWQQRPAPDYNE